MVNLRNISAGVSRWRVQLASISLGEIKQPSSSSRSHLVVGSLRQTQFSSSQFGHGLHPLSFYGSHVCVQNPLYQLETLYNMKQLVDVPTRETLNTSSLLDVIFTTNDQSHSTTGVYKIGLSDHYMIFTVYSNVHDRDGHHENVLQFRNYKTFSTERFLNDLLSLECIHDTDWCSSLPESKWYEFKNAFIKLSNDHAPIQCRRLKNKSNPWFDADILAMIYRRDYLKRKAIACKDHSLWQDYRSQRNAVTRVIGLYRDVWIAAIASSRTRLATLMGVMCKTSQCELRSLRVNSGMLNVILIVTYYTLPPLESPDTFWIAMAISR